MEAWIGLMGVCHLGATVEVLVLVLMEYHP
jgi:hypothetical protein